MTGYKSQTVCLHLLSIISYFLSSLHSYSSPSYLATLHPSSILFILPRPEEHRGTSLTANTLPSWASPNCLSSHLQQSSCRRTRRCSRTCTRCSWRRRSWRGNWSAGTADMSTRSERASRTSCYPATWCERGLSRILGGKEGDSSSSASQYLVKAFATVIYSLRRLSAARRREGNGACEPETAHGGLSRCVMSTHVFLSGWHAMDMFKIRLDIDTRTMPKPTNSCQVRRQPYATNIQTSKTAFPAPVPRHYLTSASSGRQGPSPCQMRRKTPPSLPQT